MSEPSTGASHPRRARSDGAAAGRPRRPAAERAAAPPAPPPSPPPPSPPDELPVAGPAEATVGPSEALQAAALQLISAARGFLDVAEQVARDPHVLQGVLDAATDLARTLAQAAGPVVRSAASAATRAVQPPGPDPAPDPDGLEHISLL